MDRRWTARAILVFGIAMGWVTLVYQFFVIDVGVGGDFRAYYLGANAWLAGDPVYGPQLGATPEQLYLYAPITLLLFLPFALFPAWFTAFVPFTVVQLGCGLVLSWVTVSFLRDHGRSVAVPDVLLITLFVVGSSITVGGIRNGNVNVVLAMLIGVTVVWIDDDRKLPAAAALVTASLFKIFIAFYGVWFLFTRSSRAIAWSGLFGLLGLAGSLLVGVETTIEYVTFVFDHGQMEIPAGGIPPAERGVSLLRPLSQVLPYGFTILALVSIGVLLCVLAYLWAGSTDLVGDMHLFLWIVLAPTLVYFPEYLEFTIFPLVVLLYTVTDSREYVLLGAGTGLLLLKVGYGQYSTIIGFLPDGQIQSVLLQTGEIVLSVASVPLIGIGLLLVSAISHARSPTSRPSAVPERS